ncbi:hypothetical protein V6Z11_D07G010900 [Gossypium hirsutum]
MLETLQTSVGVFVGSEEHGDTCNNPLIIATELCRVRMVYIHIQKLDHVPFHYFNPLKLMSFNSTRCKARFPQVVFSLIESEYDISWEAEERETDEAVAARGVEFIKWLLARKEKEIAVVSHGGFLKQTLLAIGHKCDPLVTCDNFTPFDNCKIRSVIISVDEVTN